MKDKEKTYPNGWVKCYICDEVFKRKRETKRYCNNCKQAACEGEHLTFQGRKIAICIPCYIFAQKNSKKK